MYPYSQDIATSAAVNEIKIVYVIIALILMCFGIQYIGLMLLFLTDSFTNTSIESTIATYGTTAWIIVIELLLFCGFLSTTWIVLGSVLVLY